LSLIRVLLLECQRICCSGCVLAVVGTAPAIGHLAAAILPRFRNRAVAREHRVDAAGQFEITLQDRTTQFFISVLGAKGLELIVEVEDHCRIEEAPSGAAGLWVKPDDKESLATEA